MVTAAAAAIDSGAFTPTSTLPRPRLLRRVRQARLERRQPGPERPEAYGNVTLAQGFQHSINSVFCNVGKQIGGADDPRVREEVRLLLDAAARDARERARAERALPRRQGPARALVPEAPERPTSTRAGSRSGRSNMVGDAAADGSWSPRRSRTAARPAAVHRATGRSAPTGRPSRRRSRRTSAARSSRRPPPTSTQMMISVVQGGTGTAAQIPGRPGRRARPVPPRPASTTSTPPGSSASPRPTIRRSPSPSSLEDQLNGFGGAVAAPIAKQVLEKLLHG